VPNFLETIQSWPPEKKKKATIWVAALAMAAIIIVWLFFFNNLLGNAGATVSFWKNSVGKVKEIINNNRAAK
jgi:uncharacterized membrane protein YvbJ